MAFEREVMGYIVPGPGIEEGGRTYKFLRSQVLVVSARK